MNCAECQERLAEYALDSLVADEAAVVAAHLDSGCAECCRELYECRAALAAVALTAPAVEPPAHVRRELMARVRGDVVRSSEASVVAPPPPRHWLLSVAPYLAAMLCAVAAGMFLVNWLIAADSRHAARAKDFEEQLAEARRTFDSPQVRFAALDFSAPHPGMDGYMVLDPLARQIHFVAFDLGAPAAENVYRLWLVTRGEKWLPAGVLNVDSSGNALAVVDLPALEAEVLRAVVSEDPRDAADAAESPRGPVHLSADFESPSSATP